MSEDVQLRQLEYLVALAQERHFGRAAAASFVTQPALSAGLRRLESELGVTLVLRGRHFHGFTPEGQRVVGWAHRILAERDGLTTEINRIKGGLTSPLRLGSIPTGIPVACRLASRFQRLHPQAGVKIETLPAPDVSRRLADFTLDVGLTYLEVDEGRRRSHELYRERYLLLMPEASPLAEQAVINWEQLSGLPLCALNPTMKNRRITEGILAAHGVSMRTVMETDNVGALFAYVGSGGVSCVVSQAWISVLGLPIGTCARSMTAAYDPPSIGLLLPPAESTSLAAETFLRCVRDVDVLTDAGT